MKRVFFLIACLFWGCGYTTRVFVGSGNIYVKPVVNEIEITSEERSYSQYTSFPLFIEKKLTNALVSTFNVRGSYKVTGEAVDSFTLEGRIYDYKKEALRYSDSDEVVEQRLRLYLHVNLCDRENNVIKAKDIAGETTYFLSGPYAVSESEAITDLVDDTARRVVDVVSEDW